MGRASRAYATGLGLAMALAVPGSHVSAASVTGSASATVVQNLPSLPIVIHIQGSAPAISTAFSRAAAVATSAARPESTFGITLISVDADGLATFSVAGATTSSYAVQTGAAGPSGPSLPGGEAAGPGRPAAGLIFSDLASGGGDGKGVSIAISQSSVGAGRELAVTINFN